MTGPVRPVGTVVLVAAALAGCGSTAPKAAVQPAASTVTAGPAQNGQSVDVRAGTVLVVDLPSTYWSFGQQPSGAPLQLLGVQTGTTSSCAHTIPGSGCGFARARFRAVHTGSGTVTAARTSCGEALRCSGAQGSYRLVVRVTT